MSDEAITSTVDPRQVVRRFVGAMNAGSLEEMERLLTPDHCLIDSAGEEIRGRDQVLHAWRTYLELVPKYRVTLEKVFMAGNEVVALGHASGGHSGSPPGTTWSVPAAWRIMVEDDRIREWQVFADNQPLRELIRRHGP